jgi:endonuclease/exonuclease/phosphatase family metal-dependent hydrolase
MKKAVIITIMLTLILAMPLTGLSQTAGTAAQFKFNGNLKNSAGSDIMATAGAKVNYTKGLDGKALVITSGIEAEHLFLENSDLKFAAGKDFSIQFWIKSTMDASKPFVIMSQKDFPDNSLSSQKNKGWVLYSYGGTWAWNMGSGTRRITHERENGTHMPINDGKWHLMSMTYNSSRSEIRLYYDGNCKALYNVSDSVGFDFTNPASLVIGWNGKEVNNNPSILPEITRGAEMLQALVDEFNSIGLTPIEPEHLESVVVEPKWLFDLKVSEMKSAMGADSILFLEKIKSADLAQVMKLRADLMKNAYTVHQVRDFMKVARLLKIYSLNNSKILINKDVAWTFTENEKLYNPEFVMENLEIWNREITPDEIVLSYSKHFTPEVNVLPENAKSITSVVWNIHHGGKHNTIEKDGWDSRMRIVEMLREENADVIMMQETYSSGDFIAAELGYYFASTVDWDYLNQGANISVLSRYPIKELLVPHHSPFMNVGVKIAVSQTQDIYVMSNWYGMAQFPFVFDFHSNRFIESDSIPVLFGGDFNAVPHTDGGDSPASVKMAEKGFTDAYRSLYPDVLKYPGHTYESGIRIDQLYYKGRGLKNRSTKVVSSWPAGFPSDHNMIVTKFELDYSTR